VRRCTGWKEDGGRGGIVEGTRGEEISWDLEGVGREG
jgi:hypothetical protein